MQRSFDAHRGWHLGPVLGRNWPRIAALFAYIDPGEQQPVVHMLRQASPDDLDTSPVWRRPLHPSTAPRCGKACWHYRAALDVVASATASMNPRAMPGRHPSTGH